MFNDPGDNIGPKSCDLWKPVIASVNGMACGGAFYMLGEVEFIIAADHATFFDPHVTYGMTAAFEPIPHGRHHAVRRHHAAVAHGATTSACRPRVPSRSAW
jgi:enoyl-CoA hydratase/carnithine racemase